MQNQNNPDYLSYADLDLFEEIKQLKAKLNAVILAHYYQEPDIQDIADFVGDSLGLAQEARKTNADVIVFVGVHFMAETAKIINPQKKVILPDLNAGCSLADSAPYEVFKKFREKHADHVVISYINCSAEIKTLSDIICTSSNAEKIIRSVPKEKKILFAPDKNLGQYLIKKTGRDMLLWQGSCIVHETFSQREILKLKQQYPQAKIIAHPECEDTLLSMADFIGSTTALLQYSKTDDSMEYIVATESGILHPMMKASPHKTFIPAPAQNQCACNMCPYMRLNTLEKIYHCMQHLEPEIIMDEHTMDLARKPILRMLELSTT